MRVNNTRYRLAIIPASGFAAHSEANKVDWRRKGRRVEYPAARFSGLERDVKSTENNGTDRKL